MQNLPTPIQHGWNKHDGQLYAVLSTQPPVNKGLTKPIFCGCNKSKCNSTHCKCYGNSLACTEACLCMGDKMPKCCKTAANDSSSDDKCEDHDD